MKIIQFIQNKLFFKRSIIFIRIQVKDPFYVFYEKHVKNHKKVYTNKYMLRYTYQNVYQYIYISIYIYIYMYSI